MANNKRFFKTISLAHWHVKLATAAQEVIAVQEVIVHVHYI